MNSKLQSKYFYWSSLVLFVLYLFSPVCLKFLTDMWGEGIFTFIRPLCVCISLVACLYLINYKWLVISFLSLMMISTLSEIVVINNYSVYMDIDHFMAYVTTNLEETTTFARHNLHALWYLIPMIVVFCGICFIYSKSSLPSLRTRFFVCLVAIAVTAFVVLPIEKLKKVENVHAVKAAVFENTFKRPPLSIFHLTKITVRKIKRSLQANNFVFNSTRTMNIEGKEIYVLAIGESVRYSNCSLNGIYKRNTMPLFAQQPNMLFFHNYYSGGCSTAISVPMILTRATPDDTSLSYKEKSVLQVFKENGFTTAIVKRGILGQISSAYLYQGVDVILEAKSDEEVIEVVDSLSKCHDKLFVMFQLSGSHFYYDNFPEEFNHWRPNSKYDNGVKSDSLLVNSYDNTILYTDYLLSTMIDSLQVQDAISCVWYVSDHGQMITATQGWHGTAQSREEYHVPLCIWYTDEYKEYNGDKIMQLESNLYSPINSDNLFYTICGMTNIVLPKEYAHDSWDISSRIFELHPRKIFVGDSVRVVE